MVNFLIGCVLLALCLTVGYFIINLVFIVAIVAIAIIGSGIGWIIEKLGGK